MRVAKEGCVAFEGQHRHRCAEIGERRRHWLGWLGEQDAGGAGLAQQCSEIEAAQVGDVAVMQAEAGGFEPAWLGHGFAGGAGAEQQLPPIGAAGPDGSEKDHVGDAAGMARSAGGGEEGTEPQTAKADRPQAERRVHPVAGGIDAGKPIRQAMRRLLAHGVAGARIIEAQYRRAGCGDLLGKGAHAGLGTDQLIAEGWAEHEAMRRRPVRRMLPTAAAMKGNRDHGRLPPSPAQACGQSVARTASGQASMSKPCCRSSARATRSRPKPAQPVCAASPSAPRMP